MTYLVYGLGHLADTLRVELDLSGVRDYTDLGFVAHDVTDHRNPAQLDYVLDCFGRASAKHQYVAVLSQVPPGWMRRTVGERSGVYYQVDTIIVSQAVARMLRPEQLIIGCADPAAPLPLSYQRYVALHDCPVLQMSYESAELAKCAINYVLAKQIKAARDLYAAAQECGADYADVEAALRGDARIGPHAYLRPGSLNQHLLRDVETTRGLIGPRSEGC